MAKVTILKNYRNTETLRQLELSDVVRSIQTCQYHQEVETLRDRSFIAELSHQDDETIADTSAIAIKVPRVCFATEMENRKGQRIDKGYTGMVLLEVNNLASYDEAVAVRQGAGLMPQTLLAFVGVSGLSVKIVCQGELFGETPPLTLPSKGRGMATQSCRRREGRSCHRMRRTSSASTLICMRRRDWPTTRSSA